MKKFFLLLSITILLGSSAKAQSADRKTEVCGQVIASDNYDIICAQMDAYWDANPTKWNKGSGFKPYARWKEYWQYYLNADRTLMSSEQIADQYLQTKGNTNAKTAGADLSNWQPLGPFTHTNKGSWSSGQGRVNITTVDPNNPNTIYIGSANGGLWRSTNNGTSWIPLTDFLPSIGISGIAIDPSDSKIIYISTGDEDGNDAYTDGIYKSINSGLTWTKLGFPFSPGTTIGEVHINPFNPKMLWVVGFSGFYKSVDGGTTWSRKTTIAAKEIRQKPGDSSTLYVVERSGTAINILKSIDAGETFSTIQTYAGSRRAMIAVTPADPNYLYVLVASTNNTFKGLYRSINSGSTFTAQNTSTNIFSSSTQAYYDLALAVSDTNANTIFTGCLDLWKSTNGGTTIVKMNNWNKPDTSSYTHADIHDIKVYNGKVYLSSDGGIYTSNDYGITFSDKTINGLNISQFYRIDVAQTDTTQIVGGLQDNGGYSYSNKNWVNFYGADGMDAAIDPTNIQKHVGFIQYGGSMYGYNIDSPSVNGKFVCNDPANETGNWITPLEYGNGGTLYAGFSKLYRLTGAAFAAVNSKVFNPKINQIRVHPTNDSIVLVSDGKALYESDGSSAFSFKEFTTLPMKAIKNFDYNRSDSSIIYVVGDTGVFKTVDAGATWQDITYTLPAGSKNSIIHQSSSKNNTVYLAMNKAVYYIDDSLSDWQLYSKNLPNTTITDIEVNNIENHVIISTYGRGIWRSNTVPEALSIDTKNAAKPTIYLYPNPVRNTARLNTNVAESFTLRVFNVNGALQFSRQYAQLSPTTALDFAPLAPGVYFFTLTSEHHLITKKFIKE